MRRAASAALAVALLPDGTRAYGPNNGTKVTTKASTLEVKLGKRLPPGSYLLSAYPVDRAGYRSPTEKRRTTIRRLARAGALMR